MHRATALGLSAFAVWLGFASQAVVAQDTGRLTVRAVFKGDEQAYRGKKIQAVEGTECIQFHPILTEDVQINRGEPSTLRNVVVWIKSGPIDFRDPAPSEPITVTASRCTFAPHVVAVRENQPLYLLNQDSIKHRFQLKRTKDPEFSVVMPKPGMQISLTLEAEYPIPLVSPTFPWMQAWVLVFDHPYFATTGLDGVARFSAFPPGDYELVAWHEKFGVQNQTVTVKAGETTQLDFVFETKNDAPATKTPAESPED